MLWPGDPPLLGEDCPPFGVDAALLGIEDPPVIPGVEAPGEEPGFEPPCEDAVEMLPVPPFVVDGEPFETGALVTGIIDVMDVGGIVKVVVASGALVAATASTPGAV